MPIRKRGKCLMMALAAAIAAIAGACRGELAKPLPEAPRHELYLTLPFCLGVAIDKGLERSLPEFKQALESERSSGACLEEARRAGESIEKGEAIDSARLCEIISFSLAFAPADGKPSERKAAGCQLACDVVNAYSEAVSAQKRLEDASPMLASASEDLSLTAGSNPEAERAAASKALEELEARLAKLHEDFDNARLRLVEAMNFHPVTDIRLDSSLLESRAQPQAQENAEEPLPPEELSKCQEAFPELKELLALPLSEQANARRRDWALLGLKAARTLLEAKGLKPVSRETVCATLLARARLALATVSDARAAYEVAEEGAKTAQKALTETLPKGSGAGIALARAKAAQALLKRDEALGELSLALELLSLSTLQDPAAAFASSPKGDQSDEPADPTLVETTVSEGEMLQKSPGPELITPKN